MRSISVRGSSATGFVTTTRGSCSQTRPSAAPSCPVAPRIITGRLCSPAMAPPSPTRSEEHTSELQSRENLVCRLLLEKKKTQSQCEVVRACKLSTSLNQAHLLFLHGLRSRL